MKNRPNKPGFHWYKNNYDGEIDGAIIGRPYGRRSGPLMVFHPERDNWSDMEHFEECEVSEWVGPAYPPKKLLTWKAEVGYKLLTTETDVVIYDDVKEFSIGDDDDTE